MPLDLLEHALLVVVRADAGEGLDLLALVVLAEHGGELLLLLVRGGAVLGVERLGHLALLLERVHPLLLRLVRGVVLLHLRGEGVRG